MMFIIGVYILFLGILMDDATTYLLFLRGFGSFETNPLYVHFGVGVMFVVSLLAYALIIFTWGKTIKIYKEAYVKRIVGYKLFDVVIFMMCFLLVFMSFTKMELGYGNIVTLTDTYDEVKSFDLKKVAMEIEQVKVDAPEYYVALSDERYKSDILADISYFKYLMIVLFSFLLFKVGYKVVPYELA